MRNSILAVVGAFALMAAPAAQAGEWHAAENNMCTDCHTMHFSQQHNWDGTTPVSTTPAKDGNWLGATGPNHYLLKLPANELCKSCHDGQSFAPDVVGANFNASPTEGRSAGALNEVALGAPYETWKGHTLDSTAAPPGYNPAVVGASPTFYDPTGGLECINCHLQHGAVDRYRNLGPRSPANPVTYTISTTNDPTKHVWVDMDRATYTPNSGSAANFNPYYSNATIKYNRIDAVVGTTKSSNRLDVMCAACHGNFHGGPGDTTVGGIVAGTGGVTGEEFIRHPTGQVAIGALSGGHSNLARYAGALTKVKAYTNDRTAWTNTSPGCVSCHKAHGNQNPFGLVFLDRNATSVGEEGGFGPDDTDTSLKTGYRNLCGQCHGQGD
jgi:hypothetical protein